MIGWQCGRLHGCRASRTKFWKSNVACPVLCFLQIVGLAELSRAVIVEGFGCLVIDTVIDYVVFVFVWWAAPEERLRRLRRDVGGGGDQGLRVDRGDPPLGPQSFPCSFVHRPT